MNLFRKISRRVAYILLVVLVAVAGLAYYLLSGGLERFIAREGIVRLAEELKVDVSVKDLSLNLLKGRMEIHGFAMYDRQKQPMLRVDTLYAKVSVSDILMRRMVIEGVRMSGVQAVLYKERRDTAANYQFFLDTFSKKGDKNSQQKEKKWVDIDLNYADFSRMNLQWDVRSVRRRGGDTLDVNHLDLADMHIRLRGRMMVEHSLNVNITDLRVNERRCGIAFRMKEGTYRTIKLRNSILGLNNLSFNYLDKRVSLSRIMFMQTGGRLAMERPMSIKIDSLRYFCNNGKPHKNTGKPNRGAFDPGHVDAVMNLEASLKGLQEGAVSGKISKLWAHDKASGLKIKNFTTAFDITEKDVEFTDARIEMANTHLDMEKMKVLYTVIPGDREKGIKTQFTFNIQPCHIDGKVVLKDISQPFAPVLSNFTTPLRLSLDVAGTKDHITFNNIRVHTLDDKVRITAQGDLCDADKKQLLSLHFWDVHMDEHGNAKVGIVKHFSKKVKLKMMRQLEKVGDVHYDGKVTVGYKHVDIGGRLATAFGNIDFDFTVNGRTHYMTGTMGTDRLEIGQLMNVKDVTIGTTKVSYNFDVRSPKKLAQIKKTPNRLPIGTLKATIENAVCKKLHFKHVTAELESNGSQADGLIYVPQGFFDMCFGITYVQTDTKQKMKVKPMFKRHKEGGMTLKEYEKIREEKQKKKKH